MAANQHPLTFSYTPSINLAGTPKQIAWAISIRQRIIDELDGYIETNTHEFVFDEFSVVSFAEIKWLIATEASAVFFIDHKGLSTLEISRIVCLKHLQYRQIASEDENADLNSEISLLKSRVEKLRSLVSARIPAIAEKSRKIERFYNATDIRDDEELPAPYSPNRHHKVDNILDIIYELERQLDSAARKLSRL
jgi:hypothetical protein